MHAGHMSISLHFVFFFSDGRFSFAKYSARQLWYGEPDAASDAIGYAMHRSRSHDAVIRVYDAAGNVIETHEHGRFREQKRC